MGSYVPLQPRLSITLVPGRTEKTPVTDSDRVPRRIYSPPDRKGVTDSSSLTRTADTTVSPDR